MQTPAAGRAQALVGPKQAIPIIALPPRRVNSIPGVAAARTIPDKYRFRTRHK